MLNRKLQTLSHENNNTLPSYAWPGGYPYFYVNEKCQPLCPACANRYNEYNDKIVNYDVNWEDTNLICENCGDRIESAYAEDEVTL